jgi:aspartyl-tRNA(Asn)/glutamyl-tRNA(Gln) amidotransferase subunit C
MQLNKDQVKKVSNLANIPITEIEEEQYSQQLSVILDYIDTLQQIKTDGVEPIYNISSNTNITREDIVSKSITQEQALHNAENHKDGFFVTKGVFDND